jgi:hypothetical protein
VSGPSGATVTALKLLQGTVSYYHLVIQLPATFLGQVTVSFVVSHDQSRRMPYSSPTPLPSPFWQGAVAVNRAQLPLSSLWMYQICAHGGLGGWGPQGVAVVDFNDLRYSRISLSGILVQAWSLSPYWSRWLRIYLLLAGLFSCNSDVPLKVFGIF